MFSKKDEGIEISRERDVGDVEREVLESESIWTVERNTDKLSLRSFSDWTVACDIKKERETRRNNKELFQK